MKKPWLRVIVIFGFVIAFSFIAAWTGCFIASRHGKRRSIQRSNKSIPPKQTPEVGSPHTTIRSSSDNSAEDNPEMLAQLDGIIADQTMANETFQGRELDALRREIRRKTKRQARGVMRTSQGINLPVNVRQLKGKVRCIIRSMTRSEAAQEVTSERPSLLMVLASSNEVRAEKGHSTAPQISSSHDPVSDRMSGQVVPRASNPEYQAESGRQVIGVSDQA